MTLSAKDFNAWAERIFAIKHKKAERLTEHDNGDGTFTYKNEQGQVRAILGNDARKAVGKLFRTRNR